MLSFVFCSCQKDEFLEKENHNAKSSSSNHKFTKLNYGEFKKESSAYSIIEKIRSQQSLQARGGAYDETFRMKLDTSQIVKVESGRRHSYTFRIVEDTLGQNRVRNLVLDFTGEQNSYYGYIFAYSFGEVEKEAIKSGEPIDVLAFMGVESYSPDYSSQNLEIGEDPCVTTIQVGGDTCPSGKHNLQEMLGEKCSIVNAGNYTPSYEPIHNIIIDLSCGDSGGGVGGDPGDPGNPGYPNPWQPPSTIGGVNYTENPNVHNPPGGNDDPDDGEQEEIDDNFGGPTTFPVLEPIEEEEDELCDELNNMNKEKPYLTMLKYKTNEEREYGYSYNNEPGATEAELHKNSNSHLDIPSGGTIYGCSHTHPNPETTTNLPMFSIPDIMWIGYAYAKHNYPKPPIEKFFTTLTVKNGTEDLHFAIKIDNLPQFMGSVTTYNSMTLNTKERLNRSLSNKYTKTDEAGGGYINYAETLYKFLEEKDIKGVAVYKAEEDLSNWSKLDYNEITKDVTPIPCN